MPQVPNSNKPAMPKSTMKSGTERQEYVDTLGGYPKEISDVAKIDKVNSPVGRKGAPGSIRK